MQIRPILTGLQAFIWSQTKSDSNFILPRSVVPVNRIRTGLIVLFKKDTLPCRHGYLCAGLDRRLQLSKTPRCTSGRLCTYTWIVRCTEASCVVERSWSNGLGLFRTQILLIFRQSRFNFHCSSSLSCLTIPRVFTFSMHSLPLIS